MGKHENIEDTRKTNRGYKKHIQRSKKDGTTKLKKIRGIRNRETYKIRTETQPTSISNSCKQTTLKQKKMEELLKMWG